ncbi:NAD-dependent epimerase/dehydratase family protein [Paenibacillus roseipurpureus]|uniref:Epimerase n=1 Tax=Paenibacillus roseopurpureus TaxID=2918901 RepID=A0AA96LP53_9BACL|nr:NAD-dependent epimerase/dehydratase family protein [Paenibacillus sp. MBLB1832]WNR43273.1 epimerase [Paenibacillus sp. MBLB1832]
MNVLLFGTTGMVGQSVLRECLLDPQVQQVISIARSASHQTHAKLREHVLADITKLHELKNELVNVDACFFCLGVSSVGMSEDEYRAITYDLTMNIARTLADIQPGMTFIYVTGASTDSTEQGSSMWARVKGKTENDLLKLPFKAAYMFRPGGIIPKNGVKSKTKVYQAIYVLMRPLYPLLEKWFPNSITDSVQVGRAMINVAQHGFAKPILEVRDIREASEK